MLQGVKNGHSYFNPRSRGGSDSFEMEANKFAMISIHAPAEGATHSQYHFADVYQISIHAPAEGATNSPSSTESSGSDFNPRSRGGSDASQ